MRTWIKNYLIGLRESCLMRKLRLALVSLSPLLIWGSAPVKVGFKMLVFPHLAAYLYGVLAPNSRLFGPVLGRGSSRKKWVALTFDDGPSEPYSSLILDTLKRYGLRATFFVVGARAEACPDLLGRIWQEGHMIGNHTYSHHPHLAFEGLIGRRKVREEIERGEAAIEAIVGERPKVFRPPQGFKNHLILETCREKGITLVGYTVRPPYHANGHSSSALANRVLRRVRPGTIINFHDGWHTGHEWDGEEMVNVLGRIIEGLKAQGYEFVALSEMLLEREDPQ